MLSSVYLQLGELTGDILPKSDRSINTQAGKGLLFFKATIRLAACYDQATKKLSEKM